MRRAIFCYRITLPLLLPLLLLAGCSWTSPRLKNLAKTDIDMVADVSLREVESLTRELTVKLYRRNPRELNKQSGQTLDSRLTQLFGADRRLDFAEIEHKRGVAAILLALDEGYRGDRVFALSAGLLGMLRDAYGNRSEFFMFDPLDPQKLYNSARNVEVLVWRLKTRLAADGRPLLLTNNLQGETRNLSYERLFGKLVAYQDMMAKIAAQKWNRTINLVVQGAASSMFLPVGL